jgi:hypothetical protein
LSPPQFGQRSIPPSLVRQPADFSFLNTPTKSTLPFELDHHRPWVRRSPSRRTRSRAAVDQLDYRIFAGVVDIFNIVRIEKLRWLTVLITRSISSEPHNAAVRFHRQLDSLIRGVRLHRS